MKNYRKHFQNFTLILVVLAFCFGIQLTTANAQLAQTDPIKAAREMIDNNQTAAAIALLDPIIKTDPANSKAYAERARAYFNVQNNEAAAADAEKALSLDQGNVVALNVRGLVKLRRKDFDGAIADFTQAVSIDPNFIKPFYNRADIYASQKKFDLAIADLNRAVLLMPNNDRAYTMRAKIYEAQGKNELAITDYTTGIRLKPNDLVLIGSRGNIYLNQNKIEQAINDYRQALIIEPQNASMNYNLKLALARQKYLKPGAKIDDAAAVTAYNAGNQAYDVKKDFESAIKFFTECISFNPILDVCYTNRADASRKLEKYDSAIADYNIGVELNPLNAKNFVNRGLTYFRQKNFEAAIKDYNRAIELDPKDSMNYVNRGASLANLDKLVEGEADVKKALQLDPNNQAAKTAYDQIEALLHPPQQRIIYGGASTETPDVAPIRTNNGNTLTALDYTRQGLTQYDNKEYAAAIVSYSNCLKAEPQNYICYYDRGLAYANSEKFEEALADVNKALEIKPDFKDALNGKLVIVGLLEKQKAKDSTYKAFGVYGDEYSRLDKLYTDNLDKIMNNYKKFTGAELDPKNLRSLNETQKSTLCNLVRENILLENGLIKNQFELQKMNDAGKLDQQPNLKLVVKLHADIFVEEQQMNTDFAKTFGCGLIK